MSRQGGVPSSSGAAGAAASGTACCGRDGFSEKALLPHARPDMASGTAGDVQALLLPHATTVQGHSCPAHMGTTSLSPKA